MPTSVLRPDALRGRTVHVAGGGAKIARHLSALGAALDGGPPDLLVVDAATPFIEAGGGLSAFRAAGDLAWAEVRRTAVEELIPAGRGRICLVAPRPSDGEFGRALAAGLENLARTLSTEWARYGIVTSAIRPGDGTLDAEVVDVVAFLASEAGAYWSGCAFTLR